ncbi:MAG: YihY/virulence factor BrkB family protein [Bacteroidales bacterium]|jgi:membrane protein|nr:YihY/virulence factor BrkB family protein [Bacteroidales bacterium]
MSESIEKRSFIKSKTLKIKEKAKEISLPGFDKVPIYNVITFFISGAKNGYLATRASAIAFNFALAIFPTMLFLFTLIPFIPVKNLQLELLHLIQEFLPQNAFQYFESTLVSVVTVKKIGVFSFGAFASLIFSTNAVHALIQAFNNTYHTIDTRKWTAIRAVSTFLVFMIFVLISASVILLTFGQFVLTKLVEFNIIQTDLIYYLISAAKWLVVIALFFFSISFLYYFAPAKKDQWKFISAGSSVATILALLTSLGFSYFVNNFGQYNKLYGSIGTIMVVLLWLYFNSFALILGFELNASINNAQLENSEQ